MTDRKSKPAPLETGPGRQMDDNIDDLGRHRDGTVENQPVDPKSDPARDKDNDSAPGQQ